MGEPAVDGGIAQRLARALVDRWPGAVVVDLKPLAGGHSGLTIEACVTGAPWSRCVVKSAPPGRRPVGRHDVLRQARLLTALAGQHGVAVPAVIATTDDPTPLFVMEFIDGEVVEPVLDAPERVRPASEVARRATAAARMLADLHAADPSHVAPDEPVTSWEDELHRWVPTMATVEAELTARAGQLWDLLAKRTPIALAPAVLHGDYRLGNLLCFDGEVRAIIDWEIWSVGDPRMDLAWFLVFTDAANLPGAAAPAPGMPSHDRLLSEYVRGSGRQLPDMDWFDALARYKMAAIMGNNLRRHREGRYHDAYQERLPPTIRSLIDQGIELLRS